MVLGEVKVAFDVQQGLLKEGQPLDFMLLALIEHLLHALHVLRGALVQLLQRLLVLFFSLRQKTGKHTDDPGPKVPAWFNYYLYCNSWLVLVCYV